jgi:hypothetical protein
MLIPQIVIAPHRGVIFSHVSKHGLGDDVHVARKADRAGIDGELLKGHALCGGASRHSKEPEREQEKAKTRLEEL